MGSVPEQCNCSWDLWFTVMPLGLVLLPGGLSSNLDPSSPDLVSLTRQTMNHQELPPLSLSCQARQALQHNACTITR